MQHQAASPQVIQFTRVALAVAIATLAFGVVSGRPIIAIIGTSIAVAAAILCPRGSLFASPMVMTITLIAIAAISLFGLFFVPGEHVLTGAMVISLTCGGAIWLILGSENPSEQYDHELDSV